MPPRGRAPKTPEEALSRALSKTLRHAAKSQNIPQDKHGWCKVEDLLSHAPYTNMQTSADAIFSVVALDKKGRYELSEDKQQIRAVQGHTVEVDVGLIPLTLATLPEVIVHGTYQQAWDQIKTSGLNKMKRQHIHMASGLPKDSGVISGMRTSSQVYIYIDGTQLLKDSIPLFIAKNGAILSPGMDGVIESRYFTRVTDSQGNNLSRN